MRRTGIIFTVLLLLAVGFLLTAHGTVLSWQDDVVIRETTLLGDAKAAADLEITVMPNKQQQLFWKTTLRGSDAPEPETEFRFYPTRQYSESGIYNHCSLYINGLNFGISGNDIDLEQYEVGWMNEGITMIKPAIDVASRTKAGETRTERLKLADYYATYPVNLDWSLSAVENNRRGYEDLQWYRELEAWLSVPVSEAVEVDVKITKNDGGNITDVDCSATENVGAYVYGNGFAAEDGLFFYLSGRPEDLANAKTGYGIFRMPLETVQPEEGVEIVRPDISAGETIYPLDLQTTAVIHMREAENGDLILLTEENGIPYLTVLERDGTERQRLELPVLSEEANYGIMTGEEDLLVLRAWNKTAEEYRILVLPRENGLYRIWLEAMFPEEEIWPTDEYYGSYYHQPVLAFDGARLAIVCFQSNWRAASVRVITYDASGLTYAGHYAHNSDDTIERLEQEGSGSLSVRWMP